MLREGTTKLTSETITASEETQWWVQALCQIWRWTSRSLTPSTTNPRRICWQVTRRTRSQTCTTRILFDNLLFTDRGTFTSRRLFAVSLLVIICFIREICLIIAVFHAPMLFLNLSFRLLFSAFRTDDEELYGQVRWTLFLRSCCLWLKFLLNLFLGQVH